SLQSLTSERVHASRRRRRYDLMTALAKNVYHLRSNKAAAADDHDFHNFVFRFRCFVFHNNSIVVAFWFSTKRFSTADEKLKVTRVRLCLVFGGSPFFVRFEGRESTSGAPQRCTVRRQSMD